MDTSDLIPVCVGACLCPGAPHPDGDFVYLRPKLGLAAGIELQEQFRSYLRSKTQSTEQALGFLTESYLLLGVAEWNLEDETGAVAVSREEIAKHLLNDFVRAQPASDKADDLYYGPVLSPLVLSLSTSLRDTSSNGSISPTNGKKPKRPRSKRSSTSTIPMADTATTSA